jgi:hypothetical protein
MNNLTSTYKFQSNHSLSEREINDILIELGVLDGVQSLSLESDSLVVEVYPQILSKKVILESLTKSGFSFKEDPNKVGIWQRFINKLREDNNKEFGGKPPQCCG